ncbi:MAG TPA: hypothetical protein VEL75_21625, partial [Candidatus Methylomirabilis sp.]|nr:hypothetical protein [Candidatus Methylomirabilis sp.]
MRHGGRWGLVSATTVVAVLCAAMTAEAVEYRLQVVSTYQGAYASFIKPGELTDGASGPGLDRLEKSLDRGEVPEGAILFDRRVQPVTEKIARAYGGVPVVPQAGQGGDGTRLWDEFTWNGEPGERSVWLVSPIIRGFQEAYSAALRGTG